MKKMLLTAMCGVALLSTSAMADAAKGKKLYQKYLKTSCGFTGAVFAAKHTQAEWEKANMSGELKNKMIEACPGGTEFFNGKKYEKVQSHLYDFVHDFASDSGNIPSC